MCPASSGADPGSITTPARGGAAGHAAAAELPAGTRLGGYQVDALHAEGGFAAIYRGHAVDGGRPVAIKLLLPHMALVPQALERLRREADAIRALAHDGVVELLECGQLGDGRPYLVMEWLEGRNLEQALAEVGRFEPHQAAAVLAQIGSALAAVHAAGLVHRDVKAQNVMAVPRGAVIEAKLVDFGIAKLVAPEPEQPALTASRQAIGTPLTMAPEQIRGEPVDARTDVYAFALLAYQLLTGRLPFRGATAVETEELHLYAPPPRATEVVTVSPAVDLALARALAKRPAERYPDIDAFLAELLPALGERAGGAAGAQAAIAVAVLARPAEGADLDDAADAADAALAEARQALAGAGLHVAVETQEAVVAWAPLAEAQRIVEAALALRRRLAARAGGLALVGVAVHAGTVELGAAGSAAAVTGELLRVDTWLPVAAGGGSWISAAVGADTAGLRAAPERAGWWVEP